jgi:hypothetical protein
MSIADGIAFDGDIRIMSLPATTGPDHDPGDNQAPAAPDPACCPLRLSPDHRWTQVAYSVYLRSSTSRRWQRRAPARRSQRRLVAAEALERWRSGTRGSRSQRWSQHFRGHNPTTFDHSPSFCTTGAPHCRVHALGSAIPTMSNIFLFYSTLSAPKATVVQVVHHRLKAFRGVKW